ncbi:MAG: hypothetical protein KTR31_09965 [Myxococcales bacterium]|nr:hypothetical protein [Myxococcales bacterium]
MVLEIALLIVGLVTTVAIGAPLATSMVQPHLFGTRKRQSAEGHRERRAQVVAFTPLDLGEDPMRWPSAHPWPNRMSIGQSWPSKEWEDEHFGAHWRDGRMVETDDAGFHAMAGRRFDSSVREEDEEASRASYLEAAKAQQEALAVASQQQPTNKAASQKREPVAQSLPTSLALTSQPPPREQLEAMIAEVGLADTVQVIMEQTGWDFRKAAQYLARVRQG